MPPATTPVWAALIARISGCIVLREKDSACCVAQRPSAQGQNPNASRTLACQLSPAADIGAGRGILTHGVGTVTALESRGRPAFPSIPQALGVHWARQLVGHTRRLIDHD